MKKKMLLTAGLALALAVTGCSKSENSTPHVIIDSDESSSVVESSSVIEEESSFSVLEAEEVVEEEIPEGMAKSYLTGEYVDEAIAGRRPVTVMLNNVVDAVPQSGIENASIVYEAPVEGGITRLMGIFEDYDALEKIGSVRSARLYYVKLALGYDAIYISYGHSKYAVDLLDAEGTDNIDGVEGSGSGVFYRTSDRVAPHNAYTSAEGIAYGIDRLGFEQNYSDSYEGYFEFSPVGETAVYEGTDAYTVRTGYTHNQPYFIYNEEDQLYYRYQFGEEQIDDLTGNQLAFKNLLLQYCDYTMYDDGKSLNIDVTSGGSAKYICNGVCTDLTWSYDSATGIEHYYLQDGSELVLNTGKTYVGIILNEDAGKVEISGQDTASAE